AAISRVSGVVDTVADTSQQTLKQAQDAVTELAIEAAIENGAQRETIEIAEITILPIQYVDAKARILIKAVGVLDVVRTSKGVQIGTSNLPEVPQLDGQRTEFMGEDSADVPDSVDVSSYRPTIAEGQWVVSLTDLEWISSGNKILGCGGGGEPYQQYLKIKSILEKSPGIVRVVSASDLPD
ncbi:hypothetical protein LTR40_014950, partial [Exophiala xenobiotica]